MSSQYLSQNALDSTDLRKKFIRLFKRFKSINETCKTLHISSSAYYSYMHKAKKEGDQYIIHRKFAEQVNDIKKIN